MRILITGAAGFAGRHLVAELANHGHTCVATDLAHFAPASGPAVFEALDIRDAEALADVVRRHQPDGCIHMAGMTAVADGLADPERMLAVNVAGTTNLLDAIREHAPATRLLTVSTAHVYGVGAPDATFDEAAPLRPLSLYAISKAAADLATLAYAAAYPLHAMVARPNNHTGPGQQPRFVVAAFARQVKALAEGRTADALKVGNLESERDFMDVRDVVRAYRLLIEKGQSGQAYNIGSTNTMRIGDMLTLLCRQAGVSPDRVTDPQLVRPTDWSPRLDTTRLTTRTGWTPEIPFEQTLQDMLADDTERDL